MIRFKLSLKKLLGDEKLHTHGIGSSVTRKLLCDRAKKVNNSYVDIFVLLRQLLLAVVVSSFVSVLFWRKMSRGLLIPESSEF